MNLLQGLLDGLGQVLAFLYDLVPNYGVAIILFTLLIRLFLLPLGIKQVRSMQAMQALQPKLKAIQKQYKGDRQKMNEAVMTLYREHGVNPLSGCLPLLAQLPILFALFAVLQFPRGLTHIPHSDPNPVVGLPQDSRLYVDIVAQRTNFLGANLLCNASQAGKQVDVSNQGIPDAPATLNCGTGWPVRIPYYAFALAMIGTTYFQQRQMQRASPTANPQQQMLTRIMPLLFGVWGFIFPAGLVVYWTTTNLVQIGQQSFLLRQRRLAEPQGDGKALPAAGGKNSPAKGGSGKPAPGSSAARRPTTGRTATGRAGTAGTSRGKPKPRPGSGSSASRGGNGSKPVPPSRAKPSGSGTGGTDGPDRKKRRNR